MNDTVIAIVSAFFVVGIFVGIIAVIAMSVFRAERHSAPGDPGDVLDYARREPPGLVWDDTGPDRHSHWSEDADNDFSGR